MGSVSGAGGGVILAYEAPKKRREEEEAFSKTFRFFPSLPPSLCRREVVVGKKPRAADGGAEAPRARKKGLVRSVRKRRKKFSR